MQELISSILSLRENSVGKEIEKRMRELEKNSASEKKLFSELCFCLLTANERAAKGIEIQEKIGDGFLTFSERELRNFLKRHGYRFYNVRAAYIVEARKHYWKLKKTLAKLETVDRKREWLVQNVKGLGYKEASHFLRNIGHNGCAILDRHIIKLMHEKGMIKNIPKMLEKKHYLENEKKLETLCGKLGMEQGELDFYLWYLKTGKVLK